MKLDTVTTNPRRKFGLGTMRGILEAASSVAVIVVAAVLVYQWITKPYAPSRQARRPLAVPAEPLLLVGAAQIGQPNAPVALLEFSDFECPFCGRFATAVLPTLKKKFIDPGQLLFAFRHMPLGNHANARHAAVAAGCAAEAGKFDPYHDLLFANPRALKPDDLRQYAAKVGIAPKRYEDCVAAGEDRVKRDEDIAKGLGVTGTPAFFIGDVRENGTKLVVKTAIAGTKPVDEFVAAVQAALAGVGK